ncbi:hypothetical protein LTR94_028257, partial [Friedmanniomyces endolithicus]
ELYWHGHAFDHAARWFGSERRAWHHARGYRGVDRPRSRQGGDRGAAAAAMAPRGDIVDRNGAPLARTIDAWTIGVHPKKLIGDPADIAQKLADLMPDKGDQSWFYAQITRPVSFTYLNRRASPALVEAVNAIGASPADLVAILEALKEAGALKAELVVL